MHTNIYSHISTELKSITDVQHEHILSHHMCHDNKEMATRTLHDANLNIVDDQSICTTPSHVYKSRRMSLSLPPSSSVKYIKPTMVEMEFDYITNHVVELLSCCDPKLLIRWCEGIMASETNRVKLFSGDFIKILKQLKTSLEIFNALKVYWSWSNHSILLTLSQFSKLAMDMLLEFDSRLNHHLPLSDYPISSFDPSLIPYDDSEHTLLAMKCGKKLQPSLQLVFDMESLLVEKFSITKHCFYLLAVEHNPTRLYWMIPKGIVGIVDKNADDHFGTYCCERNVLDLFIYPYTFYKFEWFWTFKKVSHC